MSYALVTPVRTEEKNLVRLAGSLEAQTLAPAAWIIVDNGSEDGTFEVAQRLTEAHSWVHVISAPPDTQPRPGAPIVRAFHAGLEELAALPDIVVKLDADTSMEPDHFRRLVQAFSDDARLGIASGTCLELDERGEWQTIPVTRGHVRGAVRAYRRACLEQVLPLEERVGWDGIDELKAAVLGWETQMLPNLCFYHHRRLGARDGTPSARWRSQGEAAWYMGYRCSYLLLRSLHHARRDRAALAMFTSYVAAAARREPRYPDADVRTYLRERQTLRALARRYLDAQRLHAQEST